jgi:hypothetical protein
MLSWSHLLGNRRLVETLTDMGADPDAADDLGITARFWKEYFATTNGAQPEGERAALPEGVRLMLDRVSEAKGRSLQNRTVLSVKSGPAGAVLPEDAGKEEVLLLQRMNEGFGADRALITKPGAGPVTLLGFMSKLPKSREVTAAEFILWDAKINALKRVAAGHAGALSPIHIIALYLYTGNAEVFHRANAALHREPSPASMWPPFVQCIYQALELLPHWRGEAYRAVGATFDPEAYAKGRTVTWNSFSIGTQEWRKVAGKLDQRNGIVFIIRSSSAREVHPYSRNAADKEVIFLPETSFEVVNYYKPSVHCLGQENIRATTYAVTEKDIERAARGLACIVVELREVEGGLEIGGQSRDDPLVAALGRLCI